MKHIEIEQLIEKFEGRQSVDVGQETAVHLTECGDCRAEWAKLTAFFAYAEMPVTDQAPQAVTARILNIYQRKPAVVAKPQTNRLSGLVSLLFDDWQMAVSERFSNLDSRQMLYRVGDFEVDLRLELVGETCTLTGQVFPEVTDAIVEIISGAHTATAKLGEFGEFTFANVPQGVYDLQISVGSEVLNIEKVPLHR